MGREQVEALIKILQDQLRQEQSGVILGSWGISYEKERAAFVFDKCEHGGYCEERPSVIGLNGQVLDAGGPLLQA